jgi:hypothetical protein
MYQVYQLGDNASVTLSLLSVGLKRKDMCFILKNMGRVKRHIIVRFVLRDRLLMSLKLTIMGSWKKSLNQNRIFLFKCYWYCTTDRGIIVDHHHVLVEINSKARLHNVDNVFVFTKQCQQVYYTHTLIPLKRIVQELIDYP